MVAASDASACIELYAPARQPIERTGHLSLRSTGGAAAAPTRRSRRQHRSPRPLELHRRPEPESTNNNSAKWKWRRQPAAADAARPAGAGASRARVEGSEKGKRCSTVGAAEFGSVDHDPVPRCARPAPAPSPPPRPGQADVSIGADRPSSIVPPRNLRTTIPAKRNVDVGQQPQRRAAGRCRSVGVRACWNRRLPRARA
jgi:hypothetical protein